MKLIHDVVPINKLHQDTAEDVPPVSRFKTETMVKELYRRRVGIEYIFGRYYELDLIDEKPQLTVGDAELAVARPIINDKPF